VSGSLSRCLRHHGCCGRALLSYSNELVDPIICKNAAISEIQKQADIIFPAAEGCGVGALDAAAEHGVLSIGTDTDEGYIHPDSVITSAIKRIDMAVYSSSQ
jgi:basic membrane protein A and related proteins